MTAVNTHVAPAAGGRTHGSVSLSGETLPVVGPILGAGGSPSRVRWPAVTRQALARAHLLTPLSFEVSGEGRTRTCWRDEISDGFGHFKLCLLNTGCCEKELSAV